MITISDALFIGSVPSYAKEARVIVAVPESQVEDKRSHTGVAANDKALM
jgi:hypothetical protein